MKSSACFLKPSRAATREKLTCTAWSMLFYIWLVRAPPGTWLPKRCPPWETVYGYFCQWKKQGFWLRLHDMLRVAVRPKAGKHIQGRKRHILGLLMANSAHAHFRTRPRRREIAVQGPGGQWQEAALQLDR